MVRSYGGNKREILSAVILMGLVVVQLQVDLFRRESLVRCLCVEANSPHDVVPRRSTPLSFGTSWSELLLQGLSSACCQMSRPVVGPLRLGGLCCALFSFSLVHSCHLHSAIFNSRFFKCCVIHMSLLHFRMCYIP